PLVAAVGPHGVDDEADRRVELRRERLVGRREARLDAAHDLFGHLALDAFLLGLGSRSRRRSRYPRRRDRRLPGRQLVDDRLLLLDDRLLLLHLLLDRKSTRLNSSHVSISYAVFCLKK